MMTLPTEQCDFGLLRRLVDHQLDDEQTDRVERHLSRCHACQREVESIAGSNEFWRVAGSRLANGNQFDVEFSNDVDSFKTRIGGTPHVESESKASDRSSTAALRYVAQLLGPTDDPQSMGRIGTYEVHGLIGIGGMGIVVKAFDRSLNRFVAIKILSPLIAMHGSARQRFFREARAAAAVTHENVLAIHAIETWQDIPYLVMPYINGESLEKRIRKQGPLDIPSILRIAFQIASGLSEAHAQGLVHRDIKPANILMSQGSERLKISDFGLARAADDASLTRSGTIAGTPAYMSPEQARGDAIDQRSDLFSFGSLLYELCTGHPPFRAETPFGILQRIANHKPRAIHATRPEVPIWLCGIIDALLEKAPSKRVASAAELADLFRVGLSFLSEPDGTPLPVELSDWIGSQESRPIRFRLRVKALVAVTTLAVLAVFAFFIFKDNFKMRAGERSSRNSRTTTSKASELGIESSPKEVIAPSEGTLSNLSTLPHFEYQFFEGEKIDYRVAMEIERGDGAIDVDGTLQFEIATVNDDSYELKYWLSLNHQRVSPQLSLNPFHVSAIEGEVAQLRRCDDRGRIKISRSGQVLGRSKISELPAQLGPIADLIFPTLDFNNDETKMIAKRLSIQSLPAAVAAGPPSGIPSIDCDRVTEFRVASFDPQQPLLVVETLIKDQLDLPNPISELTSGTYVFDRDTGRLSNATLKRDLKGDSAEHFAKLTMSLSLVDSTPTIQDK